MIRKSNNPKVRKRQVKLAPSEDLVEEARAIPGNLSGAVESLLVGHMRAEHARRLVKAREIEVTVATWNTFGEEHGTFADEYSTL